MEISCKNITMRFGNKTALENVSLELRSGSLIGLIGSIKWGWQKHINKSFSNSKKTNKRRYFFKR